MGLLSFFRRRTDAADASTRSVDGVTHARTRARRRLMGAAVLVMAGVIGFPLVFETQPRPIAVDIPIEIPRKDGAPALNMPPARVAAAAASEPSAPPTREETAPPVSDAKVSEGKAAPAPVAPSIATPPPAEPKKSVAETPRAQVAVAPPEAARAKALLEGKPVPAHEAKPAAKPTEAKSEPAREGGRFVVQAGAFADAAAAREMRARLEKLGLKSYTQVVETSSGNRTRVRTGPYATRDEAERALAKAKAAGVNGVVLTL